MLTEVVTKTMVDTKCDLYRIHTKKLSCLKSGVEFDMNDIFYEFKYLLYF